MGAAYDDKGALLGTASGDSAQEVLKKLQAEIPLASEFRIRTLQGSHDTKVLNQIGEYDPPRVAPQRISLDNVERVFTYKAWNDDQVRRGREVTSVLIEAAKVVLRNVPECPTRTRVLNDLIDARMKANAAITHEGLY